MASDDPPFLQVGTPVSAKFKGAFCEAVIKSLKKFVKCKVLLKDTSGSLIVSDDLIHGELKVNGMIQVMHNGQLKEASIQKMNDHSLYTVVFDDGDERTLRRTNVCVMGQKHFLEHENLDNLPLTDPENFLSPVVINATDKRRKRRSQPNLDEDDSDSDGNKSNKRWNDIDKKYLGKVVCVEQGERKKSWFPALGLKYLGNLPENQIYIQSFKDGKKMQVKKSDIKDFNKEKEPIISILKGESKIDPILKAAIDRALSYHDMGELPKGWNILDTIDEKDDSSDEEIVAPAHLKEEERLFQESLYDFLSKRGSPMSKPPMINNQAINLHKMLNLVQEYGGFEEVTNLQWRTIYKGLGLRNIHTTTSFNMKNIYKKYLLPYEENLKTLKSSPSQSKVKARKNFKDSEKETDKSSIVSESDSESDRRRLTRSTRSSYEKGLSIELFDKKRRSNIRASGSPGIDDKSTCSSKDIVVEAGELDIKSEAEDVDVVNSPESSICSEDIDPAPTSATKIVSKYNIGAKISIHYGAGKNQRLYTAKILEIDKEENGEVFYYIHYNGWNQRYNEWVKDERIAGLSTNATNKKNAAPPTPLTKIAKDPPPRFKEKLESDALSNSSNNSKVSELPSSVMKAEKMAATPLPSSAIIEKSSPSPNKLILFPEKLYTSEQVPQLSNKPSYSKSAPKLRDTLVIPDIKPSPIKPRTTRNSMQDTFLLNAIEESIGNPNNIPINLHSDLLLKSESISLGRRRTNRQQSSFSPKSDNNKYVKEEQLKDEKIGENHAISNKNEDSKSFRTENTPTIQIIEHQLNKNSIETLNHKESSKEDTVKKWIEESSKILSNVVASVPIISKTDCPDVKIEKESKGVCLEELSYSDRPRLSKKCDDNENQKLNKHTNKTKYPVSDIECDTKNEPLHMTQEEQIITHSILNEKDRTSEIAQTLSDFCDIVENAQKLHKDSSAIGNIDNCNTSTNLSLEETSIKDYHSPFIKDYNSERKKKNNKRKRCHSSKDEDSLKSPKKEKKPLPTLEYNVDFISDLGFVLKNKEANERICIMQSRLNEMRELYYKLRSEVASIDRRKRRKLRKQ